LHTTVNFYNKKKGDKFYLIILIYSEGHRVKCYDNNVTSLNSVYARYQSDKAQLYADQVVESPNFIGQVLCLSRLEETVNDAQFVFECVVEDYDVKTVLLEKISSLCPIDAIIATSTLRMGEFT
jgi:3-hydroxyacyl-CoA dehydrogenase